ncbi:hypothetical protein [Alkalitalea saponilacus]|uniref:Uncharacterized protein n=1 Tax=Alkalitalea saponilacus TaxID=889453 RepID=A0A1T5HMP5_9BACT|nr:hypothetical protein [Alkalitalea saponilacus]SKC21968.1 hypothetical protein SAMN03080601_02481 [Alkalitalea saponilacus]
MAQAGGEKNSSKTNSADDSYRIPEILKDEFGTVTGMYHSQKTITAHYESNNSTTNSHNGGGWNVQGAMNPHISAGLSSTNIGGSNTFGSGYHCKPVNLIFTKKL